MFQLTIQLSCLYLAHLSSNTQALLLIYDHVDRSSNSIRFQSSHAIVNYVLSAIGTTLLNVAQRQSDIFSTHAQYNVFTTYIISFALLKLPLYTHTHTHMGLHRRLSKYPRCVNILSQCPGAVAVLVAVPVRASLPFCIFHFHLP